MNEFAVGYVVGLDHTRHHMLSALPHAPVVVDPTHRPGRTRIALAQRLYTAGDRMTASARRAQLRHPGPPVVGS